MTLSTIQTTIRLALIALISTTVVVACGPEKHKRRMPMKAGNQKGINPKTGLANTPLTPEQQKKQAENLQNRTKSVEEIEALIAKEKPAKQIVDKNALKDGNYTLDKVTVFFKYMNGQDDMRIYREHGIQNFQLTDIPGSYKAAGFVASFSDAARFVEVPLKFIVDRTQNQDWTAAGDAAFPQVVNLRSEAIQNIKEQTHDLRDENQNVDKSNRLKASVLNMLVSAQFANNAYTIQDENGKTVTLRLFNVSDTRLNISFDIDEAGPKPLRARSIVLSYAIEAKAAATPTASAPTTTQDGQLAAEQLPANQTGTASFDESAAPPAASVPGVD